MKNITIPVEDEIYEAAVAEAARLRKSVTSIVGDFLAGFGSPSRLSAQSERVPDQELEGLYAMSERKHAGRSGSVGPLNREEMHERGTPHRGGVS